MRLGAILASKQMLEKSLRDGFKWSPLEVKSRPDRTHSHTRIFKQS